MWVPRSLSGLTGLRPIFFSPTRLDKRKPVTNGNRIRTFVGTKGDYARQRGTTLARGARRGPPPHQQPTSLWGKRATSDAGLRNTALRSRGGRVPAALASRGLMCTSLAQRGPRLAPRANVYLASAALAWRLGLMWVAQRAHRPSADFFSPTRLDKRKPVTNGNRIRTFVGTKGDYARQRGTH
jgi:hypothetical protein